MEKEIKEHTKAIKNWAKVANQVIQDERPFNWDAIDNETKQAEEEESEDKKDEQLAQEDRFYRFIEG